MADGRRQNSCDCVEVISLYPEKAEAGHLYYSLKAGGIRELCLINQVKYWDMEDLLFIGSEAILWSRQPNKCTILICAAGAVNERLACFFIPYLGSRFNDLWGDQNALFMKCMSGALKHINQQQLSKTSISLRMSEWYMLLSGALVKMPAFSKNCLILWCCSLEGGGSLLYKFGIIIWISHWSCNPMHTYFGVNFIGLCGACLCIGFGFSFIPTAMAFSQLCHNKLFW